MPVSEEGSGIALANIERRLALAYGGRASIALRSGADGALARVVLPLELVAHSLPQRSGGVTS